MARFNCLVALLVGKKKKSKGSPTAVDVKKGNDSWNQNKALEDLIINTSVGKGVGFDPLTTFGAQEKVSTFNEKFVEEDNLVGVEAAYEGGDEHDEILSMKRDFSDFDLQARASENEEFKSHGSIGSNPRSNEGSDRDEVITPELMIQSGHVSDPGMHRVTANLGSPMLMRSCSNIETKRTNQPLIMSPAKSQSYNDLKNLSGSPLNRIPNSPLSVMTNYSADKVMLKKRSSSQVLPSRSRKIWWKLFLWSHRNLHNPSTVVPKRLASIQSVSNKKDGYCSDTLEARCVIDKMNKKPIDAPENENQIDLWPQNQWVAFSAESSSLDRVNAWVNSLEITQIANDEDDDGGPRDTIVFPCTTEIGESSGKNHTHGNRRAVEEIMQANNIIQSLNTFSSVAHIAGMGLKVIPSISAFSSLRSVNLAGNFIVHITPGSLPKSLHTLDLSRNKITTIEGLRELTRLRVLNLSYNRISRIGHGLSNCTLIKELYLAGNKISDVEGLHRLLKLTVLDLSFNKITTAKSLGQLVANYHSLLALNLLGNPIQTNIGDDHLRKSVTGLLPQLTYLNRQPVKPQRAREAATDSVAKAALGNVGGWSSRRRTAARRAVGHGSTPSLKGRDGASGHRGLGSGPKSSNRGTSKSRH